MGSGVLLFPRVSRSLVLEYYEFGLAGNCGLYTTALQGISINNSMHTERHGRMNNIRSN